MAVPANTVILADLTWEIAVGMYLAMLALTLLWWARLPQ